MKSHLLHLILVLLCATLSMGVWFLEFSKQIAVGDLEWLGTIPYSIFLIGAFVVLAYLHPFFRWENIPVKSIWWASVELYATLVTSVLVSRLILFSLFTHFYGWLNKYSILGVWVFLAILMAYSFYTITQRRLVGVRGIYIFLMALGLVLIAPFSYISVVLVSLFENSPYIDILGAFQIGYPFFWLVVVLGMVGWISVHRLKAIPRTEINTEILDDGV